MIHFRNTNRTNNALCGAIVEDTDDPAKITCGECAAKMLAPHAARLLISRQLLTRLQHALKNASSFMSGFLEDDTQEGPIDEQVEAIDNLLAELQRL